MASGHDVPSVDSVPVEEIHELRRVMLRTGTPSDKVEWAGDRDPGTVHLAIRDESGQVIAAATFADRPLPDRPDEAGVQLRGMAVRPEHQGRGLGAALVEAGVEHARRRGAALVWANARDSALRFYVTHGFEVIGEEFVTADTGLPHHRIVRAL